MKILNTYRRPIPRQTWHNVEDKFTNEYINAILTEDENKKKCVYIGIGTDEFVCKYGIKLCYDEALHYYPMLKKEEYKH